MKLGTPRVPDGGRARAWRRIVVVALPALLATVGCAAQPAALPSGRPEPIPPDPEAITVYGRYHPSLESLSPAGIEIGDLNMAEGRLVIQVRADGDAKREALVRALKGSPWYRDAKWETTTPGSLRSGEHILSVKPVR